MEAQLVFLPEFDSSKMYLSLEDLAFQGRVFCGNGLEEIEDKQDTVFSVNELTV